MLVTTILFDLDGTLLPQDQDMFLKAYFGHMMKKLNPCGYDPDATVKAIMKATYAMIQNDGSCTNEQAFWRAFAHLLGDHVLDDIPLFDDYYHNEFQLVAQSCGFTPKANACIKSLKVKGYRLALATNPLFPAIATESRMRWAGLDQNDFELYTTYENSTFCKPNPAYYREIAEKLGVSPEECLMVGNDVDDDMVARELGMQVFLLTDCLINKENVDIAQFPHGSFEELMAYIG